MINIILKYVFKSFSRINLNSSSYVIYDYTFGFAGHSRELYFYYKELFPSKKVYFITKKPNLSNDFEIPRYSLKGLFITLFFRNFAVTVGMPSYVCLKNKRVIQFWHGTPIKSLGIYDNSTSEEEKNQRCKEFSQYTKIIVQNKLLADSLIDSFCVQDKEKVYAISNPYLESIKLTRKKKNAEIIRENKPNLTIIYLPTYRNEINRDWDLNENKLFKSFVENSGIEFLTRYHPSDKKYIKSSPEVIDLLSIADILITDYSSTSFDAYEVGIETLLYWSDHEKYICERGVNLDFLVDYHFKIFHSTYDLIENIKAFEFERTINKSANKCYSENMKKEVIETYQ